MRILGAILIVLGLLLCLTVIGILVGIPLMLIGAVLVAVGGRRKVVIHNTVSVSNAAGPAPALASDPAAPLRREPAFSQTLPDPQPVLATLPAPAAEAYDKRKWESLVKYDEEIRTAAERIRPFGQKWEDELADAYLRINDKAYLKAIAE